MGLLRHVETNRQTMKELEHWKDRPILMNEPTEKDISLAKMRVPVSRAALQEYFKRATVDAPISGAECREDIRGAG